MSTSQTNHRRTHNILLISKLLSQREGGVSPFTLLLDTLEQSARPVLLEYARRAKLSRIHTIYLAFETSSKRRSKLTHIDTFISCYDKSPSQILQAANTDLSAKSDTTVQRRCLILIDSIMSLCLMSVTQSQTQPIDLMAFLSGLLHPAVPSSPAQQQQQVSTSVVTIYHQDVPIPLSHHVQQASAHSLNRALNLYTPNPLALLSYLATTIITVHSLPILLAEKSAQDRSVGAPSFGLAEEKQGVIVGLKKVWSRNLKPEEKGIVLELEHRRRSGRGVREWYFMPLQESVNAGAGRAFKENVTLLDDHPLFRKSKEGGQGGDASTMTDQELSRMTFELGLTERQRKERDGVVLPYFDAQRGGLDRAAGDGPGEGGRILYEMSVEDDFDEEEDEI